MVDDRDLEDTRDEESYESDYERKEAEALDRADYEYDRMMEDKYDEW